MSQLSQNTYTDLESVDLLRPPDVQDEEETSAPVRSLGKDEVLPPPDDP